MIIGIIGVNNDIDQVADLLCSTKDLQYADMIEVLRLSNRYMIGSLTTKLYHKKYVLKKLESIFGTVVVSGNLVLSEDVCEWLLSNGNVVAVASRDKLESYDKSTIKQAEKYWEDKTVQRYNLEVRFKKVHEKLHKNSEQVYRIDLSNDNCDDLNGLLGLIETCDDSSRTDADPRELLELIETIKEVSDTMTMEESIKKAMRELGMEVDDIEGESPQETPKKQPKEQPKKKAAPKASEEKPKKDFMNPPKEVEETEATESFEEDESESIFVKFTDNAMALLIPVGMKLERQTIGGVEFDVATVAVPDVNNRKLQELEFITAPIVKTPDKKVVRTPIISSKPANTEKVQPKVDKPMKTIVVSGNLSDLQEEKARIDAEIKKYRKMGDMDTVNALRKQRHAVRNKINKLK